MSHSPAQSGSGHGSESSQDDIWSKRYEEEGHIWGDNPSLTAITLAKRLEPVSNVLEIGFGYGRDLIEIVEQGHRITGIEKAAAGLTEALKLIRPYVDSGQAHLQLGEFSRASIPKGEFDAVFSHRVLHLLGKNGLVRAFESHAARVLKPGGLLLVSARNHADFNPDQMVMRPDKMAEYKNRPGHLIRFWNEQLFRETFEQDFDILEFIDGTEIESQINPVDSHFTLMIARRKAAPQTPSP